MAAKKKARKKKTADERRTDVALVALSRNLKMFQDAFCGEMLKIRHGVACIDGVLREQSEVPKLLEAITKLRQQRDGGKAPPVFPPLTLRVWRAAFQAFKAGVAIDDPRTLGEVGLQLVTELERMYGYPHKDAEPGGELHGVPAGENDPGWPEGTPEIVKSGGECEEDPDVCDCSYHRNLQRARDLAPPPA